MIRGGGQQGIIGFHPGVPMNLEEIQKGFVVGKLRLQESVGPKIAVIFRAVPLHTGTTYGYQHCATGIMDGGSGHGGEALQLGPWHQAAIGILVDPFRLITQVDGVQVRIIGIPLDKWNQINIDHGLNSIGGGKHLPPTQIVGEICACRVVPDVLAGVIERHHSRHDIDFMRSRQVHEIIDVSPKLSTDAGDIAIGVHHGLHGTIATDPDARAVDALRPQTCEFRIPPGMIIMSAIRVGAAKLIEKVPRCIRAAEVDAGAVCHQLVALDINPSRGGCSRRAADLGK